LTAALVGERDAAQPFHLTAPELLEVLRPSATRVARDVGHKFKGYVQAEAVYRELVEWAFRNSERIAELVQDGRPYGRRSLESMLDRVARGIAWRAKADQLGFSVHDLYWYSRASVQELLPMAFDYDDWTAQGHWFSRSGRGHAGGDPAALNNLVAQLCDVKAAFFAASQADQRLLYLRFVAGVSPDELANEHGVDTRTASRRINSALDRAVMRLGGARPWFPLTNQQGKEKRGQ
jgi:DNA-directed RNA polymerase specialized sigma24 family protein